MVARIEHVPRPVVYGVFCDEEHGYLGTFQFHREAREVAEVHNLNCDLAIEKKEEK